MRKKSHETKTSEETHVHVRRIKYLHIHAQDNVPMYEYIIMYTSVRDERSETTQLSTICERQLLFYDNMSTAILSLSSPESQKFFSFYAMFMSRARPVSLFLTRNCLHMHVYETRQDIFRSSSQTFPLNLRSSKSQLLLEGHRSKLSLVRSKVKKNGMNFLRTFVFLLCFQSMTLLTMLIIHMSTLPMRKRHLRL